MTDRDNETDDGTTNSTDHRIGSVVIHYDPAELDVGGLIDLTHTANLLALDFNRMLDAAHLNIDVGVSVRF